MPRTRTLARAAAAAVWAIALAACGGGKDGPTQPQTQTPASASVQAGDDQTAEAGAAVATPPAVRVLDADGAPVPNVAVTFSVASGGGAISGGAATTNGSGIARVGSWTLGPTPGANKLRATVSGLTGAIEFDAMATAPSTGTRKWTVLLYLAADNNLAVAGVQDLDELEAAGVDGNVAVAVEAEFSQTQLQQAGCSSPQCINRPNWNTFRYAVGNTTHRTGPDGQAQDIGNRDMTSAAELRDFVQWGMATYPAEHYAVVLWNHGGGYVGLIEDVGSAGSHFMSLDDVKTALTGLPQVDLLDFDMCLMGGYETLAKLQGLARYVKVSEETVPGEGNPYKDIVQGLRAAPDGTPAQVAAMFADKFNQSYAGNRASTTVSVYDMAGFAAFEGALNGLANGLRANMGGVAAAVHSAAAVSQKFEYKFLTDLGDFLDSLRTRTGDATLRGQIDAVKSQIVNPGFRVRSLARDGSATGAAKVNRATGLHVLLPSGGTEDRLPASGPASFGSYAALYPNAAWTQFLTAYLASGATLPQVDQGETRFESYLVWDQNAVAAGADIDMWVVEPDGTIYIPFLGSVTPNGRFTNDSYDDQTYFEGYLSNRYVAQGTYYIYANLFADPNDFQPAFNLAYRFGQTVAFQWLFTTNVRLTKQASIFDDPNPTFQKIDDGAYTDMVSVATWNPVPAGAATMARPSMKRSAGGASTAAARPRITAAQVRTIAAMRAGRRAMTAPSARRSSAPTLPSLPLR